MKKIDNYINIVKYLSSKDDSEIVLSLQNTVSSKIEKNHLYFLPVRKFNKYLFGGICNGNNEETRYFLKNFQEFARFILIDVEKKYPWMECNQSEKIYMGNIELLVNDILDKKKVIYIWPNSMTVDACIGLINKKDKLLSLTNIGIIGIGNIGYKLALRLVEAGSRVSISSQNYENTLQLATSINQVKPKTTVAAPTPLRDTHTCVANKDIVFICTGGNLQINKLFANSLKENAKIFSLSKLHISEDIQKIFTSKNIEFSIVDITSYYYLEILKNELCHLSSKPLRKEKNGFVLVSGGYQGNPSDIVVDNALNPLIVLGEIDFNGNFQRKLVLWEQWLLDEKN